MTGEDSQFLRQALGRSVRVLRHRLRPKCTQEDLGFEIGIDRSYVSALERGDHMPRMDMFVKLAEALKVSPEDLMVDVYRRYQKATPKRNRPSSSA